MERLGGGIKRRHVCCNKDCGFELYTIEVPYEEYAKLKMLYQKFVGAMTEFKQEMPVTRRKQRVKDVVSKETIIADMKRKR